VEWLSRLWNVLLRDVVLTLGGLAIIWAEVASQHPNLYLIGAGLSLTLPSTYSKLAEVRAGVTGSSSPPLPPPGPEPSPLPSRSGD